MVAIAQVQRIDGDVAIAAVVQGAAPAKGLAILTGPERSAPQLVTIHVAQSAEGDEPPWTAGWRSYQAWLQNRV